jgi:hypothetical protein
MSAFTEKSVAEVRSKESGPACYENMLTLAILHETLSFSDPQKGLKVQTYCAQH